MPRFLLDTSIAGHFVHHRHGVYDHARSLARRGAVIGVCVPVLGELWSGVELSDTRERNEARLRKSLSELTIWPYTNTAAKEFGRIFADLKRRGPPIQQIDVQIAAVVCTLPDCTLVTMDSDFQSVPGMKIVDWTKSEST